MKYKQLKRQVEKELANGSNSFTSEGNGDEGYVYTVQYPNEKIVRIESFDDCWSIYVSGCPDELWDLTEDEVVEICSDVKRIGEEGFYPREWYDWNPIVGCICHYYLTNHCRLCSYVLCRKRTEAFDPFLYRVFCLEHEEDEEWEDE